MYEVLRKRLGKPAGPGLSRLARDLQKASEELAKIGTPVAKRAAAKMLEASEAVDNACQLYGDAKRSRRTNRRKS
jgi:hypothetical protein